MRDSDVLGSPAGVPELMLVVRGGNGFGIMDLGVRGETKTLDRMPGCERVAAVHFSDWYASTGCKM